ncbi:MAG: hypothetical protein ABIN83_02990 [Sphingomicrobium sp.]
MRILAPTLIFALAACSTVPKSQPVPVAVKPTARPSRELVGLSAHDLGDRFGQPRFQVQEGPGTKLQWSGDGCVLDVYLYPPANGQGIARVTYSDARRPSGADIDVHSCLALMGR